MNNIQPGAPNDPLSKVLREWKVATPLPPRFQEQVWKRIAQSEAEARQPRWSEFLSWLDGLAPRRAMAVSYLSVLLVAGVASGYWRGQANTAHTRDQLGSRYLQSVDPYQTLVARK